MAQKQKFHYASKGSFNLSQLFSGVIPSGYYAGFDFLPDTTMVMKFKDNHPDSGIKIIEQDLSASRWGLVITKQGVSIYEGSPVPTIQIEANTEPTERYDAIVCQYQFQEIPGGIPAQYVVITIDLAEVPDPYDFDTLSDWLANDQTIIGVLKLPAGTVALNQSGVTFVKAPVPTFAKTIVDLSGKADLEAGKLKDSQIPPKLLNIPVPDIAARDALTGLQAGQRVWVSDATGDPSVASGSGVIFGQVRLGTNNLKPKVLMSIYPIKRI